MSETPHGELRAADADRDRVAAALRAHCVDGRLTMAELSERLAATYDARTLRQLAEITADLPDLDDHPLPVPADRGTPIRRLPADPAPRRPPSPLARKAVRWAWVSVLCVAIWAVTGFGGYFWPFWVIVPWGGVLGGQALADRFGRGGRPGVD